MAAANTAKKFQDEVTCPICLEYFNDPVSLDCDHSFCRTCITQCWGGVTADVSCPQCRRTFAQGNLRPDRKLRSFVDMARELQLQAGKEPAPERLCEKHQEPLKLFSREDEIPICVVYDRSKGSQGHNLIPAEEAAEEFQERLQAQLKTLRAEREKLLGLKVSREKTSQKYLKQTQVERQKIVAEFQQLRQFLEEQERLLLAQLKKLDKELVRLQIDTVTKLSEQISRLSERIRELEGKCQKPASEFLQDVRSTLSSCEKVRAQQPEEMAPELEERVRGFSQKVTALSESLREFKDTLPAALEKALTAHRPDSFFPRASPWMVGWNVTLVILLPFVCLASFLFRVRGKHLDTISKICTELEWRRALHDAANVTLDPDTAHPQLILSEDGKRVRQVRTRQPPPDIPERFDYWCCVLGLEGFTSGRHYWEVEVGGGLWAVGVARESVSRKGEISLSPKGGIWAVGQWGDEFEALTDPHTALLLSPPSRIRVCLDCDRGQVTFIDAGTEASIFTFPPGSLPGERIRPWVWVWGTKTLQLFP
ncbi:zinc finger protein RFP-like isoform X4 [Pelodiscus sinensis]|uniref:zinc finger protein RFP-like isoform X4 n=1 Tax=Pelodiscus sinensis TaxID=13735 RepID=UPI003F6BD509